MPVAAVLGAATVIGGGVAINSANKAAKVAKQTAAANNALQQSIYNENKATLSPFVLTGGKATTSIEGLLGLGGDKAAANSAYDAYLGSTGYQSRLAEGQKQVTAVLGGKGLLDSGAAQKALLKYGQTFASNEFGNYLGALQGQQQVGLSAASAQAGVGQNYANAVSANNNASAETQANAALSVSGNINGILGNALSAYGYTKGFGSSYRGPGQ